MRHAFLVPVLRALSIALALIAAGLTGCADLDNIDVEVSSQATIPGATPLDVLLGQFPQLDGFTRFDLAQSSTFRNSEYDVNDVDSVTLTSMTMSVAEPEGQDLSFLGEVVFFVETAGLERREIARQESFPEGADRVAFEVVPGDIKSYVMAAEATVTAEVSDSKRPDEETTIRVDAVFDVDIKVF